MSEQDLRLERVLVTVPIMSTWTIIISFSSIMTAYLEKKLMIFSDFLRANLEKYTHRSQVVPVEVQVCVAADQRFLLL